MCRMSTLKVGSLKHEDGVAITLIVPPCPVCKSTNLSIEGDLLVPGRDKKIECLDCHTNMASARLDLLAKWAERHAFENCPICGQWVSVQKDDSRRCSSCGLSIPKEAWNKRVIAYKVPEDDLS